VEAAAPAKKAPVRRSRAKKMEADEAPNLLDGLPGAAAEPSSAASGAAPAASATGPTTAPAKRAPRRRATSPVTAPAAGAVQGELSLDPATAAPAAATQAAASAPETAVPESAAAQAAPARKAPARRSRATAGAPADAEPAQGAPAPGAPAQDAAAGEPAADAAAVAAAPKTARGRRKPAASSTSASKASAQAGVAAAGEAAAGAVVPASAGDTEAPGTSPAAVAALETSGSAAAAAEGDVAAVVPATGAAAGTDAAAGQLFQAPGAGISALFLAPDLSLAVPIPAAAHTDGEPDTGDDEEAGENRRGRGRNRNRRNRASESGEHSAADAHDDESGPEDESEGVTSRRRRRRRRGEADLELTGGTDEDPPNTVTKVRAPRAPVESSQSASNRVTSLRGSTRLEAKKQRRRDSRDSGRRRTVITEAEFLARRESVDRVMVVRQHDERIQIGVLEDGILAEHFVSKTQQDSLIGNVYLGRVQNVLPSMEAAFVDIGRGRNAVLYAGEVDWDGANLTGQPRRIEIALKSGDSVLVQVSKDPVGHKGARLTSQISLPGRYLVYVPGGSMTGISRKLPDVERNRLKRVLKDHLPENAGVIVRTAAEGASEQELTNDINRLRAQWEGINTRATSTKTLAPEMLYAEPDLTIKVVRDVFNEDFTKLIVAGEEAWDTIEAYVTYVAPDLLDRLEKWTKAEDIFGAHRIDEQISKALERKVFLPSGGSLVIDRTEAMTVVDVNTGKFTGSGGNLEETVTKNNLEAAEEVVRQLRLRDIGGIIVIDFIDMVLESNRDLVLRRLVECLGRDRTKHQVAEVTSLGLVQMTRKRMGTGLLEVFGEQCEACAGRGMVTHEIPVEHRRVHTVAAEQHHPQPGRNDHREAERTANRSTRSERKRNRNRSHADGDHQDVHDHAEAPVIDEATEAERLQKATQARAALASIAAAAAAAHHEGPQAGRSDAGQTDAGHAGAGHDGGHTGAGHTGAGHTDDGESVALETLPTSLGGTATVTLGGEAVALPRGHRHDDEAHRAEQAAALAGLAQALDQLAGPKNPAAPAEVHGTEPAAGSGEASSKAAHDGHAGHAGEAGDRPRSRRPRRNRSARSAQGGADMSVDTSETSAGQGGTAHSSAAAQPAAKPEAAAAKEAAPIIMLGVGVPASEL
jgi:ribonuclease E